MTKSGRADFKKQNLIIVQVYTNLGPSLSSILTTLTRTKKLFFSYAANISLIMNLNPGI